MLFSASWMLYLLQRVTWFWHFSLLFVKGEKKNLFGRKKRNPEASLLGIIKKRKNKTSMIIKSAIFWNSHPFRSYLDNFYFFKTCNKRRPYNIFFMQISERIPTEKKNRLKLGFYRICYKWWSRIPVSICDPIFIDILLEIM